MTTKNTIIILGDSTSMSIGVEHRMYPFLLANAKRWPAETELVNCSLPGFTSADAAAFFFRHRREFPSIKAIIVYLGNCDSTATEIHKGQYSRSRQFINTVRDFLGKPKRRSRLRNRLLHFEWNSSFDPLLEEPENPVDFEHNLRRIIISCSRAAIPTIMVRPMANRFFPPGTGKGNFVFYRYLGINEKIAGRLHLPDERFKDALFAFEKGNFSSARQQFQEILLNPGSTSDGLEFPLVVTNNYAVCAAESGNISEAEHLFQLLLQERGIRKEIILYNLAQLFKKKGEAQKFKSYIDKAYEADSSLYRIRSPYIKVIDRLASEFSEHVRVVDMESIIPDHLYLDHCHPLPQGQSLIADRIADCLSSLLGKGEQSAVIRNILYNPELALGNFTDFYTYYRTYAPYTREEIRGHVKHLENSLAAAGNVDDPDRFLQIVPKEMRLGLAYHLKHPVFPSMNDLLHFGPEYPSDIGRFPELFLVRYVIPYLRCHERELSLQNRFSESLAILRSSALLLECLPEPVTKIVACEDPFIDNDYETERLDRILARTKELLAVHLLEGNKIFERLKTTIFWYVRESLRFGSHSRISMRYDRVFLEYAAEALAIAGVLDLHLGCGRQDEILNMISLLEETATVHEKFCSQFSLQHDLHALLEKYDQRLLEIAAKLKHQSGLFV